MISTSQSPDLNSTSSRRASGSSGHQANRTSQNVTESMYSPPEPATSENSPCKVSGAHGGTNIDSSPNFTQALEKGERSEGQRHAFHPRRGSCHRHGAISSSHRGSTSSTFVESEQEFDYVLGVVNPASGECNAAQYVLRSMRMLLGGDRVIILEDSLFANPAPLHEAIRNHAVRFIRDGNTTRGTTTGNINGNSNSNNSGSSSSDNHKKKNHNNINNNNNNNNRNGTINIGSSRNVFSGVEKRGTIIVSGGDGTVSFVMEQLDVVRDLIEKSILTSKEEEEESEPYQTGLMNGRGGMGMQFILPAVAVLALGTGNDYSNCVGFGGGYTQYKVSGLCCCVENPIEPLIRDAISAPAVPFDRWVAQLAPLSAIWEQQRQQQQQKKKKKTTKKDGKGESNVGISRVEGEMKLDTYAIDWNALYSSGKCLNYHFINYFSIGFDAYVLQKFDSFRKRHPRFCRTRWNNKLVYGMYGLKAAFRCTSLRSSIPAICVPQLLQKTNNNNNNNN
ncbi:diacylglycerol kinase, partial [Trypanosoma theileri]